MNKFTMALAALIAVCSVSCKKNIDQQSADQALNAAPPFIGVDTLRGLISADRTLNPSILYRIEGKVIVGNGATLHIPAGTWLKGIYSSDPLTASALIVLRGAKLEVAGTPEEPVLFTSNNDVNPQPGDWGGIVLLGNATVNKVNPLIEGIAGGDLPVPIDSLRYGGNDDADNSGYITYARIEYAGANIAANNELNGLTCGGVGNGTTLYAIESAWGRDDAFEFFGGTVNGTNLVALAADDDSYDTDFGYRGTISYSLSVLDSAKLTYSSDPNGIEADNDGTGTWDTPRSKPVFDHMTILAIRDTATATAKGLLYGARFRRNTDLEVTNSIFLGFRNGVVFESAGSIASASNYTSNIVHGYRTPSAITLDPSNLLLSGNTPGNGSLLVRPWSPWNNTTLVPDFRPVSSSTTAGAFEYGTAQWTDGWAKFIY